MKVMRQLLLTLAAALLLSVSAGAAFTDVPAGHWAAASMEEAAARRIVAGFPDGTFRPDQTVSRAQLLAMVLRGVCRADVAQAGEGEAWWQPYYDLALERGLLDAADGALLGKDRMTDGVTRYELAALLEQANAIWNGLRVTDAWADAGRFTDAGKIPARYRPAVASAATGGLLAGRADGAFHGDDVVTRAEASAAVLRLMDRAPLLEDGEAQVVYTGPLLIKRTMRSDGGAVLRSVRTSDGAVVQTLAVDSDRFDDFAEQRRADNRQWTERWGRTACGADKSAFWGEIGYYTYTEEGTFRQWTDRAVYSPAADGEGIVAVSHAPGQRCWYTGGGAYFLGGDQVLRLGPDGTAETLLGPGHGLCLTAVTGVDGGTVRLRSEYVMGMADFHAYEYALAGGKLTPLVHTPGAGYSGFTAEAAAAEQQRLRNSGF